MTSLPTSAPTGPAPLAHTKEAIPKISADTPGASPASGVFSFPSRRADFRPARLGQDFLFYPLLTRHKACFHPFASPSHTPQGVFSSFMHKRTFVFSLAPSGAFSFVYSPRGAAACSIQNPHQRVTASSPECSHLGGETLGNSNKSIQPPERSEWVAEAGDSRFPVNGGAGFPCSIRKTKSCPCRARTSLRRVFTRSCPLLTRRKACFHLSCANARLCFHSRLQARFHSFLPHAAQPRALFRTPSSASGWQRRGLLVSQ